MVFPHLWKLKMGAHSLSAQQWIHLFVPSSPPVTGGTRRRSTRPTSRGRRRSPGNGATPQREMGDEWMVIEDDWRWLKMIEDDWRCPKATGGLVLKMTSTSIWDNTRLNSVEWGHAEALTNTSLRESQTEALFLFKRLRIRLRRNVSTSQCCRKTCSKHREFPEIEVPLVIIHS